MPTLKKSALVAAALVIAATFSLTACAAPDGPNQTKTPTASVEDLEDWSTKWAACMREQGQDVPDPKSSGGAQGAIKVEDPEAFNAADETCRGRLGDPPVADQAPPVDQVKSDEDLKKEQCLRDNGIELPPANVPPGYVPEPMPENAGEIFEKCGFTAVGGGQ